MSDDSDTPRRTHLRLVTEPAEAGAVDPGAVDAATPRPRSLGRLIAQTAQIAEQAVGRRREEAPVERSAPTKARWLRRLRES